jgi:hypothetical protein
MKRRHGAELGGYSRTTGEALRGEKGLTQTRWTMAYFGFGMYKLFPQLRITGENIIQKS